MTPRGGRDAIDGVGPQGELLVRVRPAPADGAANLALLRTIADAFDVAPSAVRLERGATGRQKVISISGLDVAAAVRRWPGLIVRE